ncbi:MAG: DUF1439 domain-containing protein [Deltaproteobacteria bacterium]|nr:DUF1439 domain-containing protein [Deltaproteobacteria bacterium]
MRTVLVALVLLAGCSTMTLRIPRDDLQADMAKRFPVEADKHVVTLTASDPQLELLGSVNRLAVRLRLQAASAGGTSQLSGTSRVEGRIEYVAAEHAFYLRDPKVTELQLDSSDRIAGQRLIERASRSALETLLRRHPVYRLDGKRSEKEAKAIRHLRSVRVEDQDLVLEVGI